MTPPTTPPLACLGPINTRVDGAQGLKLHDSLALTPQGVALGLVDIQVWARDPQQSGQAQQRKQRPIEAKQSHRWLKRFQRTAEVAAVCPNTRLDPETFVQCGGWTAALRERGDIVSIC
ncbi:MAG: hypothetical protein WBG92_01810 [Thiohalocapsa sp.]